MWIKSNKEKTSRNIRFVWTINSKLYRVDNNVMCPPYSVWFCVSYLCFGLKVFFSNLHLFASSHLEDRLCHHLRWSHARSIFSFHICLNFNSIFVFWFIIFVCSQSSCRCSTSSPLLVMPDHERRKKIGQVNSTLKTIWASVFWVNSTLKTIWASVFWVNLTFKTVQKPVLVTFALI